ncbi:uncharacterized protein LOC129049872 [Pongo abelii]|uniref:uncharacterized protein LOC129049872 n=1 Tax=Pongo abelii TaxID=9601 RepID=UPI003003CFB7
MAGCRSRGWPAAPSAGRQAHAHPELQLAGKRHGQPGFRPVPLPPHLPASLGSQLLPRPAQRRSPTVQRQAEGLLKCGQNGRQGRGRTESERGLRGPPSRCHLSQERYGRGGGGKPKDSNSGFPSLWTPVLNQKAPSGFSDLWSWTEKYTIGFPGSEAFGLGLSHAVSIPGFAACRSPVLGLLSLRNHDREHPGSKSGSRKASRAGHHDRPGVRCPIWQFVLK